MKQKTIIASAVLISALILAAWLLYPAPKPSKPGKERVGIRETVRLVLRGGDVDVEAKIDTGADRSSIDREFAIKNGLKLRHTRKKAVLSAAGLERRETVRLTFVLGSRTISTIATVADRTGLSAKIIIGKRDLKRFVVDPSKNFISKPGEAALPSFLFLFLQDIFNNPDNEIIILFPILCSVVIFLRLVVGIRTYGLFAPVVIAFSLFESPFLQGIFIYASLVAACIGIKILALNRFGLSHVAEMAIIMFVIVFMLTIVLAPAVDLPFTVGTVFFPLVITSYLIERASETIEEHRVSDAVVMLFSTLLVATLLNLLGNLLMELKTGSLWTVFAVSFLGAVACGRYTGLRFSEIIRFKYLRRTA